MVEVLVRQLCSVARLGNLHIGEQLLATVGGAKHSNNLLCVADKMKKVPLTRVIAEESERRQCKELGLQFFIALKLDDFHLQFIRHIINHTVKRRGKQTEVTAAGT